MTRYTADNPLHCAMVEAVYLDGVLIQGVMECDTEEGWMLVGTGRLQADGCISSERCEGVVTVKLRDLCLKLRKRVDVLEDRLNHDDRMRISLEQTLRDVGGAWKAAAKAAKDNPPEYFAAQFNYWLCEHILQQWIARQRVRFGKNGFIYEEF